MSYALGYQVGRDLTGTEVRNDALLQASRTDRPGRRQAQPGGNAGSPHHARDAHHEQRAKAQMEAAQKAAAAGTAYLPTNAKREGVKTRHAAVK